VIIGTAGHIDHGKTALVQALTGRNTDRLPEERQRGISIELGYAFKPLRNGDSLAFVDVPGHEKFVHTMLAGATGIDLALLVVAADDGVMPQTEEHLEILRLLGVARGVIALTKIDKVEPSRLAEVRHAIGRWLDASAEHAWPLFAVSSISGAGIRELDEHLQRLAESTAGRSARGRFRLAVDRTFTLDGVGTVVTGTVHAGSVREGDEIRIAPAGRRARVRSIHSQDQSVREGRPGQRCALNLVGVAREDVPRGDWAQAGDLANVTTRFDATLRLSPREPRALASAAEVHLHHGARAIVARIAVLDRASVAPGDTALVGIVTAEPLPICRGDRYVIRDASARRTMGGGTVLEIDPPIRHRRAPARLALLEQLRTEDPVAALTAWLAVEPVAVMRLAGGWNLDDAELAGLLTAAAARVAAGTAFTQAAWMSLRTAVLAAVGNTHEREPEMPGLEQNRLRRMVGTRLTAESFAVLVDEMLAANVLVRRGAFLALPEHKAELANDERIRWERIKPQLMEARFCPPRVRDLAKDAGAAEGEVRALLRKVALVGEVTLVAHDHYFLTDAVATLADIAATVADADGVARAAPFRDRIGGGRKVAIQILEFFDRVGYTRRIRDEHLLRRDNPWRPGVHTQP
jgi:selenocysteine-specific elongation factor